jgi:hypothetical protein
MMWFPSEIAETRERRCAPLASPEPLASAPSAKAEGASFAVLRKTGLPPVTRNAMNSGGSRLGRKRPSRLPLICTFADNGHACGLSNSRAVR